MIITDFSYTHRKNGPKYVEYYFYDLEKKQSIGPVGFRWKDYFISKNDLSRSEIENKTARLKRGGFLEEGLIEVIKSGKHKFAMHVRDVSENQLAGMGLKDDFIKQSATDMARVRWDFTRTQVRGLESVFEKQKEVHQLWRGIHDNIRFAMKAAGKKPAKIKKAVNESEQMEIINTLTAEIETKLKEHDPKNEIRFDAEKGRLIIILNSSNGLELERHDELPRKILDALQSDRGFVVDDIELGDYTTEHPKIYLDWYCWREDRRFAGRGFGYAPIENPMFGEDVVYDSEASDQHEVRKHSARFLFDFDPLGQGGHNNLSFDNPKRLNPCRQDEIAQKRVKGDGVFLCRPDNSEIKYSRDKGISEIIKGPGFVTDTFRFSFIHYRELFPNTKLETIIEFFRHFIPNFDFEFKKSIGSYLLIEEKRKNWERGNLRDGQDVTEYGYWDVVAHYMANITILPMIVNIADCTGIDIFSAGIYFEKDFGKRFWNEHSYQRKKRQKFWEFRNDNQYRQSNDESIEELAAETNLWDSEKNSLSRAKIRVVESILASEDILIKRRKGFRKNVSVFRLPSFALGMEKYFKKEEFKRLYGLYELMRNAKSPLEAIAYANVLDAIAYVPLFEAKQVSREDMHSFHFEETYQLPVNNLMAHFRKQLTDKLKVLKGKKIVGHTGDLMLIEGLREEEIDELRKDMIYLGQADVVNVQEMRKNKSRRRGKPQETLIMNFDGLISSRGMKLPTAKTVENSGYGDRKSVLETRTLYDFVNLIFEDKRKALEYLSEVAKGLGDLPATDYVCTQKLRKSITEYQWIKGRPQLKRIKILDFLGAEEKDEARSYAVGSDGREDTFVEFKLEEKERFLEDFKPRINYYRRLLFEEGSLIYKIASSLFFPNMEKHPQADGKMHAYENLIFGDATEDDINILLAPIETDLE